MSRTRPDSVSRPVCLLVSLPRALAILSLGFSFCFGAAAWAKEAGNTICCRASGGTRGTCLNVWAHLVPPENRFSPAKDRWIALLQGTSPQPTSMTLKLTTMAGDPAGEQILEPRSAGIRLIRLPERSQLALNQTLVWESFPTCRPNKPPTRSTLLLANSPEDGRIQMQLADLGKSCGGLVETATVLKQFGLDELIAKLPAQLPVHCETFRVQSGAN